MAKLESLTAGVLKEHARKDRVTEPPATIATCDIAKPDLDTLAAYYRSKRINCERQFFGSSGFRVGSVTG